MSFESQITGLVVASVVPDVTAAFREMAARYFPVPPVIVGPGTKTGVPILTDNPREVGADRVVNALAAFSRFGGPGDRRRLRHGHELRRGVGQGRVHRRGDRPRDAGSARQACSRGPRVSRASS